MERPTEPNFQDPKNREDGPLDLGNSGLRVFFDGGDMDCGSGLILLIRQHMERVPAGCLSKTAILDLFTLDLLERSHCNDR